MLATASRSAILIVEDHADTAAMLTRHLSHRGLHAESVPTALAAWDYLGIETPCCIILDEGMPGLSGLEFFQQLRSREETRNIPVVFYSGAYDWRKQMQAEALGARAWFVKGVTGLPTVIDAVQACCRV